MATDKRLDQVSQLTDFDYALIVKGDQVAKVSKQQFAELVGNLLYGATNASSLATVVAGKIPFYRLFGADTTASLQSVSEIKETSVKYASVSYGTADLPFDYCMILTFINGKYGMQLAVNVGANGFAYRGKSSENWREWVYPD